MSCRPNYDPCLDGKLNQIGSYASTARQSAESATASAAAADADAIIAAESAAIAEQVLEDIEEFGGYMPTGGGTDKVFYLNDNQVTTDYTLPPGKNAMSAGPITVNLGVTVTVPPGQAWTIV
jgi:hypothetical protein